VSAVQHFQQNDAGRDFVVGDIHGCFDRLRSAMERVGFDKHCDRLFSVGDLVDRGPASIEAIAWLAEPWFHAVRGNHEQMAINFADGHNHAFHYERNGGRWFIDLAESQQQEISRAFEQMPLALDVWTDTGLVGVVHAEPVPYDWREFCRLLETGDTRVRDVAMWSRDRISLQEDSFVSSVAVVYVGHTPIKQPVTLGNVRYIDTGCVFGGPLTLACIQHYLLQEAA
jgi:serine/threonine protein phosphatase 1